MMLVRDFILLMGVCLIWATNFVVTKLVLVHLDIPPLLFSSLRFALVLLVALPWLLPWPRPRWRIVVVGLMMGAGGFGLVSIGLMTATPSSAAVVTQLGVPLTALLSVFMLGERIGWRRGIGIALAFSGAIIVMYDPNGFALSFGLLFVLGSAFASAFGVVLLKKTRMSRRCSSRPGWGSPRRSRSASPPWGWRPASWSALLRRAGRSSQRSPTRPSRFRCSDTACSSSWS